MSRLSNSFERANVALRAAGWTVVAWVDMPGREPAKLGWAKVGKTWMLVVKAIFSSEVPVHKASASFQKRAAESLRLLPPALAKVRDAQEAEDEGAIELVDAFADKVAFDPE